MKIGVIGPQLSVDMVFENVDQKALFIELVPIPCAANEAGKAVDDWQDKLDGIIFTGYLPYAHACRQTTPSIPWEYMSRTIGSVLGALLNASYNCNCDLCKITYDLQEDADGGLLTCICSEAGIPKEKLEICFFESKRYAQSNSEEYSEKVAAFHQNNLALGKANICLTGMDSVRKTLEKAGYHAFWMKPTVESIHEQINKLVLRCRMEHVTQINEMYKPVVLAIYTEIRPGNISVERSEFARHRTSSNIADCIYTFAQRIAAAVEYHEGGTSYLYTTNGELEASESSPNITKLCRNIQRISGVNSLSVGVGMGTTHGLAKSGAEKGVRIARLRNATCYYIINQNGKSERVAGPFIIKKENEKLPNLKKSEFLEEVSRNSGLGMNTLQLLCDTIDQYGLDVTTAGELAQKCELTGSNINRILNKLETAGYLETVGTQPLEGAGRPKKLIRLRLEQP